MTADRDAMQQIVLHLLQNAESATPSEGEIALSAKVHTGTDDVPDQQDYLLLRVSDMGGGIPAEDLSRVFTRLYRADNALIQGVGDTGVGLSIVRTLVEAQGGRVWVDSEMGRGSTFSVLLPFAQDNNGDGSQEGTSA
jgi:signal transduction histidine kinase